MQRRTPSPKKTAEDQTVLLPTTSSDATTGTAESSTTSKYRHKQTTTPPCIRRIVNLTVLLSSFLLVLAWFTDASFGLKPLTHPRGAANSSSGGGIMRLFGASPPSLPPRITPVDTTKAGIPPYSVGNIDLSSSWLQLVKDENVRAMAPVHMGEAKVWYGVRFVSSTKTTKVGTNESSALEEAEEEGAVPEEGKCEQYVEVVGSHQLTSKTSKIKANLAFLEEDGSTMVKYERHGSYVIELQLVRTLRPQPSPGFTDKKTSSKPPPYNKETDSFVTGDLRLQNRPLIATIQFPGMATGWDVYHNISPADTRGHFMLVPTLSNNKNWRVQQLMKSDVSDLLHLVTTINPPGSLLVSYNSVNGGASQNHMHCHVWPNPPISLQKQSSDGTSNDDGWDDGYAATRASALKRFDMGSGESAVEVQLLDYPVFCIKLTTTIINSGNNNDHRGLKVMAKAISAILNTAGDVPHNVCFLNRLSSTATSTSSEEADVVVAVDAYVFLRSSETSKIISTLKMGASEMMGVFHAQSERELKELAGRGGGSNMIEEALKDVSLGEKEGIDMWNKMEGRLRRMWTI